MKIALLLVVTGIAVILWTKNNNTFKCRGIILKALCKYYLYCTENRITLAVSFDDMESYPKTFFRLWDWGYTEILPKEKFEIIKEYIDERK